jgi:hypothetical protein
VPEGTEKQNIPAIENRLRFAKLQAGAKVLFFSLWEEHRIGLIISGRKAETQFRIRVLPLGGN